MGEASSGQCGSVEPTKYTTLSVNSKVWLNQVTTLSVNLKVRLNQVYYIICQPKGLVEPSTNASLSVNSMVSVEPSKV